MLNLWLEKYMYEIYKCLQIVFTFKKNWNFRKDCKYYYVYRQSFITKNMNYYCLQELISIINGIIIVVSK